MTILGWPSHEPEVDKRTVGIGFIDLLFALVAGKVLDSLARPLSVPPVGRFQLVLAFVLTVLSWIGYHNSLNRPTYLVRFPNLPLIQLLLDVSMVVVYYFLVVTSEGTGGGSMSPSAVPEVWLVAATFFAYVLWDLVGYAIRKDDRYGRRPIQHDIPIRRWVTVGFAIASLVVLALVAVSAPSTQGAVEWVDVVLMLLVVSFRFGKERFTPSGARPRGRAEESTSALLDELVTRIRGLEGSSEA